MKPENANAEVIQPGNRFRGRILPRQDACANGSSRWHYSGIEVCSTPGFSA